MVRNKSINPSNYKRLNKAYADFNQFFDEHMHGKRQGEGIFSRYLGYLNEVTFFWFEDEVEPFAFVHPMNMPIINGEILKNGYYFYVRK